MPTPFEFVPQRVVSLVPSLTEALFGLNVGDRVVGITDYCTRPADKVKSLERVRGTKNPKIERILELAPDLVLMNSEENRLEDYKALQEAGIPIWVTGPRSVQSAINVLWDIMDIFEAPEMSARVREIERSFDYTENAMRAERLVSVFVPIWKKPWMTISQDTYMHDLLSICGGHNIFAKERWEFRVVEGAGLLEEEAPPLLNEEAHQADTTARYPEITLEEVESRQPEIVLLPSEPYPFKDSDPQEFFALDIPAAHNGHIYAIDGALLSWHGTRLAYAFQELPPIFDRVRRAADSPANEAQE